MTQNDEIFARFSPFIREYIYKNKWTELREVQLRAAKVLFNTESNLVISSATASGKTEAAFFPILSMLESEGEDSFTVLYIAPLKALINDQFSRLEYVLDETAIRVFHWHGDVSAAHKEKFVKEPKGILQITPESLESMLMNRKNDIPRIFARLRFIIIDEIHTLMGFDRGNQTRCIIERISRLIGFSPRRIGLSATMGDVAAAARWLGDGSGRETSIVDVKESGTKWRIAAEHFFAVEGSSGTAGEVDGEVNLSFDDGENRKFKPAKEVQRPNTIALGASKSSDDNAVARVLSAPADKKQLSPEEMDAQEAEEVNSSIINAMDPAASFVYDATKAKKCLIFSNSREETEHVTATMRQIAERRGEPDRFYIHHGNLSAAIREETEAALLRDEYNTACATVTLELGIDIGRLERIVNMGSPTTVTSFLQRIGRSGRRGASPEMLMVFREEPILPNSPIYQLIPWELLQAIAIIQLYIEERFIEPPFEKKLPLSLLFHQTLSVLSSSGSMTPKKLAENVLTLSPFANVERGDYRELLICMIKRGYLEQTEENELIVGLKGERLTGNFKFYAVFKDTEDFTVRQGSEEIGTITSVPPIGDRFALAGRVWQVEEVDVPRHLVYVSSVRGKMEISWPGDKGEIHTKILKRMRRVIEEDTVYPYLMPNARERLAQVRSLNRSTGFTRQGIVALGNTSYVIFPWLGTKSVRTFKRFLKNKCARELGLTAIENDSCYYLTFKCERSKPEEIYAYMHDYISRNSVSNEELVGSNEQPLFEKFDEFITNDLLLKAFYTDKLSFGESRERIIEMKGEADALASE